MNLRELAERIPEKIRGQRLLVDADPIHTAQPTPTDTNMMLLAEIWYTWVDPMAEKGYCPLCLNGIIKNFQFIYQDLVSLEKQKLSLEQL